MLCDTKKKSCSENDIFAQQAQSYELPTLKITRSLPFQEGETHEYATHNTTTISWRYGETLQ